MTTDTSSLAPADAAKEYAQRREADWASFTSGNGSPGDYWETWGEESYGWRPEISFFQPVGLDYAELIEQIEPLRAALDGLPGVDLPPPEFLHMKFLQLGFLRAVDIYWSQVETFYVNAAPRVHRVEPFSLHVAGVSAREEAVYLGVDDGYQLREVRRQIGIGVPKAQQVFKEKGIKTGPEDDFAPDIPIAYLVDGGDRAAIIDAVMPYLHADFGTYLVSHIKMGRIAPDPEVHYPNIDVVAEISMLGKDYRKGYHN
ncbi:MAG: hypothetical protein OXC71_03610 [Chloroflexi bacterium]|nr:hypothetical protein [Chloroflexota bacterium]